LPSSPLQEQLEVIFGERVPVLSTATGDPGNLAERAHEEGMRTIAMVTTVEEAVLVAERGADVVVAQGAEAGGIVRPSSSGRTARGNSWARWPWFPKL
jgi:NAD(P)H-dependent flavin oxidoreductase YrpB (nitropropane dioxygenase family)